MNQDLKCPICKCVSSNTLVCSQCGREWKVGGSEDEWFLFSKPRKVKLVRPIEIGVKLDDCIKPIKEPPHDPIS